MIKKLHLTTYCLLFFCTSTMASGYIGGGVGTVDYGLDSISSFDDPTGFELIIGSDINSNLSLEASFIDFGEASDGVPPEWRLTADSLAFGVLAKAPLNENVEVFLKIGIHMWDAEINEDGFGLLVEDDGTDLFYGIGVAVKANDKVKIGARYNSYDFDGDDVTMFSLNLLIGF